jgi:hypothetical protein
LKRINELNIPDNSNDSIQEIRKLTTQLIDLFTKGEVAIFTEVVCQCGDCKKKRDEWKMP